MIKDISRSGFVFRKKSLKRWTMSRSCLLSNRIKRATACRRQPGTVHEPYMVPGSSYISRYTSSLRLMPLHIQQNRWKVGRNHPGITAICPTPSGEEVALLVHLQFPLAASNITAPHRYVNMPLPSRTQAPSSARSLPASYACFFLSILSPILSAPLT